MLHIVTVPGGNGVTIAIPFNSGDNAAIAEQLLQQLYDAPPSSRHIVHTSDGGSGLAAVPGDENLYLADEAGTATLPNGYQYLVDSYDLTYSYGGGPQPNPAPSTSFIAYGDLDGAAINSEANAVTYTGGTGDVGIVAGNPLTAADTITINAPTTGSGGGTITLEDGGTELINLASGNWSVDTGTGTGTVTLGTGSDTVTLNGKFTINGGAGAAIDRLFAADDVVHGAAGRFEVFDHGIADSIVGGQGAATVSAQGSDLNVTGGGGQVLFIDLSGGNTVTAATSGIVAYGAGAGGSSTYNVGHNYFIFASGGGDDTINAAAGTNGPLVFGGNGGDVHLNSATKDAFVVAGGGQETIDASGSTQGVIFFGGTGATDMIGSPDSSNFYCASTGPSTMSGGVGSLYEFINHHAGSTNLITDFTASDSLYLSGFGSGAQDGIVSETDVNGSLLMTLSDGTTITFQNITNAAQLDGKIFHI